MPAYRPSDEQRRTIEILARGENIKGLTDFLRDILNKATEEMLIATTPEKLLRLQGEMIALTEIAKVLRDPEQ